MLFLSGEAAELRVTRRVSGHRASWHLFMEPVCTGEGRAANSQVLAGLGWSKGIANVPASLLPTRLARITEPRNKFHGSLCVWESSEEGYCGLRNSRGCYSHISIHTGCQHVYPWLVGPSRPGWQLKGWDEESGTYLGHTKVWMAGLLWVTRYHL